MSELTWKQKSKILWMVLFHRKTPFGAKAVVVSALLYGLMPFDLIPDFLPLLGIVDDATVFILAISVFLHFTKNIRKEMEREN